MTCFFSFQNKQCAPCQIPVLHRDLLCVEVELGASSLGQASNQHLSWRNTNPEGDTCPHNSHLGYHRDNYFPLWSVHRHPLLHVNDWDQVWGYKKSQAFILIIIISSSGTTFFTWQHIVNLRTETFVFMQDLYATIFFLKVYIKRCMQHGWV